MIRAAATFLPSALKAAYVRQAAAVLIHSTLWLLSISGAKMAADSIMPHLPVPINIISGLRVIICCKSDGCISFAAAGRQSVIS